MLKRSVVRFFLFFSVGATSSAFANSIAVLPLIDNNSLRTQLSIPFAIKFSSGSSRLLKVDAQENSSCRTLIDPFISTNFFIKCTQPGDVKLQIIYLQDGASKTVTYGPFTVIALSQDGTLVEEPTGESDDIIKGRQLWNKRSGGYSSCADCHGSPANKAHSISTGSLNTAFATTTMSTKALPLTTEEKRIIVNFVKSYK